MVVLNNTNVAYGILHPIKKMFEDWAGGSVPLNCLCMVVVVDRGVEEGGLVCSLRGNMAVSKAGSYASIPGEER
jgi:hypothetical protein